MPWYLPLSVLFAVALLMVFYIAIASFAYETFKRALYTRWVPVVLAVLWPLSMFTLWMFLIDEDQRDQPIPPARTRRGYWRRS